MPSRDVIGCGAGPRASSHAATVVVRQAGLVADQCPFDGAAAHRAVAVDVEGQHHRDAIRVGIERREVGREPLGEHREDVHRRVDRRGVDARVLVHGCTVRHERVDIGDGHADARAPRRSFRDRELVEVTRVVVVDRTPGEVTQVGQRPVVHGTVEPRDLRQHVRRELGFEAALPHRDARQSHQIDGVLIHARQPSRCARPQTSGQHVRPCRWAPQRGTRKGWRRQSPTRHAFSASPPGRPSRPGCVPP